jgi:hypothetical protein
MAMAGRKPSERPTVTRHKPTHDWTEIPNVNYSGESPELPKSRTVLKDGEPVEIPIEKRTRNWWNALIKMPHCILWQESDWEYAIDTAMVHAMASHGSISAMGELRMREKNMGTTVDFRRDMRIRYVEIEEETPVLEVVASMADRRKRLLDA